MGWAPKEVGITAVKAKTHTLGQRNLNVSENLTNAKPKFETSLFWRPKVIEIGDFDFDFE